MTKSSKCETFRIQVPLIALQSAGGSELSLLQAVLVVILSTACVRFLVNTYLRRLISVVFTARARNVVAANANSSRSTGERSLQDHHLQKIPQMNYKKQY